MTGPCCTTLGESSSCGVRTNLAGGATRELVRSHRGCNEPSIHIGNLLYELNRYEFIKYPMLLQIDIEIFCIFDYQIPMRPGAWGRNTTGPADSARPMFPDTVAACVKFCGIRRRIML
jgi:hypothetical protein